ncbi:carboxypeptidase regulatory-like domain-containing protein [Sphingobacterium sp. BN32]|uniref:carboxypeptidase regulatory-like domain-containing protein n=1 Tax=Sphingobacterium sp. BN32 TaxID=3058432 RepID=UPI00265C9CA2|nr:carboxypeptidase regulatory-like domain-containing protein [Sphingobacterium sp. BN32]WKK58565.1 carboxypeptidase regulatory-like domain-containing protein [Sphingobacterium sp. BN32]
MDKSFNLKFLLFIPLLALSLFSQAFAQGTQASITGAVRDESGNPASNTTIRVRNESTGFTTTTVTNERGNFDIKQLPLGGPYHVQANHMEKGVGSASGIMLNQGDVARVNLLLISSSTSLDAVEVTASALKNSKDYFGAATAFSSKDIKSLPVNGRNFTTLTDLSPLSTGGSLSGQLGSSTNFTIDGMNAKNPTSAGSTTARSGAPYSISMEAVREFKVVTNQYDVTFGRSGGGTISAVTKSGTNTLSGSAFLFGRADWLTSKNDIRGNKRMGSYSTYQYGFSLGGPIIKDKLHFFVVWDRQQDNRSLLIADIGSPADEVLYRINKTTLDNFVSIAQNKYGVSKQAQYGSINKRRTSDAAFLRLDYQINEKNLLTIRNNLTYDYNPLGLADNTNITLLESYGNDKNFDNSFLATLRTSISPRVTNEVKVQHLYVYQNSTQGDQIGKNYIPRAIVENVTSNIDGKDLATNLQIGGHRFAQESFKNNVLQLTNNLYWDTDFAKYTFGLDVMATNSKSIYGSEVNGRFHFTNDKNAVPPINALQNFENLKPYRYYREVPLKDDIAVRGTIMNFGLYGQLRKNIAAGLEMTAGLRMDYAAYPKATFNQLVYDELKLRTDNRLSSFILQPRLQFTWDINENQTDFLRVGGGIFASDINNYMIINNLTFDGSNLATVDVRGAQVPTPDFEAYRKDPNSIPSLKEHQLPTINFTGEDAKVPTVYKANLSYTKLITDRLKVGITGFMTLGRNNYTYIERNLVSEPFFRLANEANRGVFVPAEKIPGNGQADWKDGRVSNKLGRALELTSLGKVNHYAVVLDATYQYFKDGAINASYTWNDTKDNTSFNGNVANTATLVQPVVDDPRNLSSITYSDNQFRHKLVVYGTAPTFYGFQFGFRFSGVAGSRYTLRAGGNINGDFVSSDNDLAFIFDPNGANTPEGIKKGIQGILDNPDAAQSMKDLLTKYSGRMSERNAGINDFFGTVDLRLAKNVRFYKTHSIELSMDVFNFMNMLNKEWGVNHALGNQALYKVDGFDQAKKQYNYSVNSVGAKGFSGNPFQAQFGVRYSF